MKDIKKIEKLAGQKIDEGAMGRAEHFVHELCWIAYIEKDGGVTLKATDHGYSFEAKFHPCGANEFNTYMNSQDIKAAERQYCIEWLEKYADQYAEHSQTWEPLSYEAINEAAKALRESE